MEELDELKVLLEAGGNVTQIAESYLAFKYFELWWALGLVAMVIFLVFLGIYFLAKPDN